MVPNDENEFVPIRRVTQLRVCLDYQKRKKEKRKKRVHLDERTLNGLNEFDEFCFKVYECSDLYKEKMKEYHD